MSRILIVYHTLSGNTKKAAECVAEGAREVSGVQVDVRLAADAGVEDLLSCDGIALGTPDYFSYMAGMVKDFFDRTYYPTREQVEGMPCVTFISHGGGGRAKDSVERICSSFGFRMLLAPVMVRDAPDDEKARELRKAGRMLARECTGK